LNAERAPLLKCSVGLLTKFANPELRYARSQNQRLKADRTWRFLCFDLKDIFLAIGNAVNSSTWRCHNVECVGENANRLYELSEKGKSVSGLELSEIGRAIFQSIDGGSKLFAVAKKNLGLL